jgi:hypothetical protein
MFDKLINESLMLVSYQSDDGCNLPLVIIKFDLFSEVPSEVLNEYAKWGDFVRNKLTYNLLYLLSYKKEKND